MKKLLILVVLLGLFAGCGKSKWKVTMECTWSGDTSTSSVMYTVTQDDSETATVVFNIVFTSNNVGGTAETIEYLTKHYQNLYPKAKIENDKGFITVTDAKEFKLDSGEKDYAVKYLEARKSTDYDGFNCTIK
ncbi:MAG: hypothetical protein LBR25_00045 [Erysipelotrichaceae bacterium]|jgi:hypothetical protein|nr:hypothetical protein [Erysipelotrichaceae bacterium]